jgi:phosphopantetheine adenylyltransferase
MSSQYSTVRNAENVTKKCADSLAQRMYVAADKAGMADALRSMRAGVIFSGGRYVVDYEAEVREAGIEIDHAALDRAQVWLDRATTSPD